MSISQKLAALNITLPPVPGPFGAYVPARRVGNLIYTAGQLPMKDGKLIAVGQVPSRCPADDAKLAARQCVVNALAVAATLPGGVDVLKGVVRVGVFVSCDASFTQHSLIANAASELLLEIFGEPGKHARTSIGVAALPLDAAVEVEVLFEAA